MLPDTVKEAGALLPRFATDNADKQRYLSWRICEFSASEALSRARITPVLYEDWLKTDPVFVQLEQQEIGQLRNAMREELLQQETTKNERRRLAVDAMVLEDALDSGVDNLGEQSFDYLKTLRTRANPEVRRYLGITEDDQMPSDWEEAVLTLTRRKRDGKSQETTTGPPEAYIEGEYKESTDGPTDEAEGE